MIEDRIYPDVAQAYVAHRYSINSRRFWQILIRMARGNGDIEPAKAAKNSLDCLS